MGIERELNHVALRKQQPRKMLTLILSAAFALIDSNSAAADARFERLTIDQGYPGGRPISLAQDAQGFLWIADLQDGLIRYDGYEFRPYRHDRNVPGTMSSNEVSAVYVDSTGVLWVATNAGLNRYDSKTDHFTTISTKSKDPAGLSDDEIGFSLVDSLGRLWVGTSKGLNRLDPGAKLFHQYHVKSGYRGGRQEPDYFWTGFEDSQGQLWFGSAMNGGLHRYDPESDTLEQFVYDGSSESPPLTSIRSITEDTAGYIWLAGAALTRLDPKTMTFERMYLDSQYEQINVLGLPEYAEHFWSVVEDPAKNLWLATQAAGVIQIAPDRRTWTSFRHDPSDLNSIPSNEVMASLVDNSGQVWFGGLVGLSRFNPLTDTVDFIPLPDGELKKATIQLLSPLNDGRLVTGIDGHGLWLVDPKSGNWSQLPWPGSLGNRSAHLIWTAPDGSVWVALASPPFLFRLDATLTKVDLFELPAIPSSFYVDRNGDHWFGLLGHGLARLNPKTRELVEWKPDPTKLNSLGHPALWDLFEDSKARFMIATYRGLDLMDRATGQFTHFDPDPDDSGALTGGDARRIVEDEAGNVWVQSSDTGIHLFNVDSGTFTHFPLVESPIDTPPRTWHAPVSKGRLWWGTTRGIGAFDFKLRKYFLYGPREGLTTTPHDIAALPDGRIAMSFGDRIGLFSPDRLRKDAAKPTPVITRITLGNRKISHPDDAGDLRIDGSAWTAKKVSVPHNHVPLTFEFSALHFASPSSNRYAYRLEGLDKEWFETDARNRRATYTTLPAGTYTFRVKAANPDGLWNEAGLSLELSVLPPWWETWWAYLLYGLVASLLLLLTVRIRTRSLHLRATTLELQVASRTEELVQQKAIVESQAKHLEQLIDTKDRLMTRVSHEFRTPLTVILGPIDRLQSTVVDETSEPTLTLRNAMPAACCAWSISC